MATIRPLKRKDIRKVLEIEREAFEFPWNEEDFVCTRGEPRFNYIITDDGRIVGYVSFNKHKSEIELMNIAVHREHRMHGFGKRLISAVAEHLGGKRRSIAIDIRETNLHAQLFLKSCGFMWHWTIPDAFECVVEDAYHLVYEKQPYIPSNRILKYTSFS